MSRVPRLEPVNAYALVSPHRPKRILTFGISEHPNITRRAAAMVDHVPATLKRGETPWSILRKAGWRLIPVKVSQR